MITGRDLRVARLAKRIGMDTLAQRIGRTKSHLSRVERGLDDRAVTPALIRDYERALGVKIAENRTEVTKQEEAHRGGEVLAPVRPALAPSASPNPGVVVQTSEWPLWFGMQTAQLVELTHSWRGEDAGHEDLQALLHQEILMFDAVPRQDKGATHSLSRRQALTTIAALPLALSASGGESHMGDASIGAFLSRCAASLTACWHLLRGSDIYAVDRLVAHYIVPLDGLAHRTSAYQASAARLASQAHRICGIIALHRNQLAMREHHCKRALHFASISADNSSRASALISLASTFFYDRNPEEASAIYERALVIASSVPPLQQSRIHAELSVAYGQVGRENDTLRCVDLAQELFPSDPEHDRSFLYADFTRASLALEIGLSYIALAERYPERRYPQKAAHVLSQVLRPTQTAIPDRIRYEIVNQQARTAVLLNDLEAFEIYMREGATGAAQLGSRQRQSEMQIVLRHAIERWPNERRLRSIGDQVTLAIGN